MTIFIYAKILFLVIGALMVFLIFGRSKQETYSSLISENKVKELAKRQTQTLYQFLSTMALTMGYNLKDIGVVDVVLVMVLGYLAGIQLSRIRMMRSTISNNDSDQSTLAQEVPGSAEIIAQAKKEGLLKEYVCTVPPLPVWMTISIIVSLQILGLVLNIILKRLGV
ncbi:MAG: hypothetical protein ACYC0V_15775 [Armatimonadota bacterium]